ncbi:MAG: tetratricopeptide repeat protein, partial [Candidatus Omnitrophota bacterium]|nr:tetratricopeptide repeat protein [Candidatus Omnitrophota bacterium]
EKVEDGLKPGGDLREGILDETYARVDTADKTSKEDCFIGLTPEVIREPLKNIMSGIKNALGAYIQNYNKLAERNGLPKLRVYAATVEKIVRLIKEGRRLNFIEERKGSKKDHYVRAYVVDEDRDGIFIMALESNDGGRKERKIYLENLRTIKGKIVVVAQEKYLEEGLFSKDEVLSDEEINSNQKEIKEGPGANNGGGPTGGGAEGGAGGMSGGVGAGAGDKGGKGFGNAPRVTDINGINDTTAQFGNNYRGIAKSPEANMASGLDPPVGSSLTGISPVKLIAAITAFTATVFSSVPSYAAELVFNKAGQLTEIITTKADSLRGVGSILEQIRTTAGIHIPEALKGAYWGAKGAAYNLHGFLHNLAPKVFTSEPDLMYPGCSVNVESLGITKTIPSYTAPMPALESSFIDRLCKVVESISNFTHIPGEYIIIAGIALGVTGLYYFGKKLFKAISTAKKSSERKAPVLEDKNANKAKTTTEKVRGFIKDKLQQWTEARDNRANKRREIKEAEAEMRAEAQAEIERRNKALNIISNANNPEEVEPYLEDANKTVGQAAVAKIQKLREAAAREEQAKLEKKAADEDYLREAKTRLEAGEYDEAVKATKEAIKLNKDSNEAYDILCQALDAQGKYDESAKIWECARKNDFKKNYQEADRMAEREIRAAISYFRGGDKEKAFDLIKQAVGVNSELINKVPEDIREQFNTNRGSSPVDTKIPTVPINANIPVDPVRIASSPINKLAASFLTSIRGFLEKYHYYLRKDGVSAYNKIKANGIENYRPQAPPSTSFISKVLRLLYRLFHREEEDRNEREVSGSWSEKGYEFGYSAEIERRGHQETRGVPVALAMQGGGKKGSDTPRILASLAGRIKISPVEAIGYLKNRLNTFINKTELPAIQSRAPPASISALIQNLIRKINNLTQPFVLLAVAGLGLAAFVVIEGHAGVPYLRELTPLDVTLIATLGGALWLRLTMQNLSLTTLSVLRRTTPYLLLLAKTAAVTPASSSSLREAAAASTPVTGRRIRGRSLGALTATRLSVTSSPLKTTTSPYTRSTARIISGGKRAVGFASPLLLPIMRMKLGIRFARGPASSNPLEGVAIATGLNVFINWFTKAMGGNAPNAGYLTDSRWVNRLPKSSLIERTSDLIPRISSPIWTSLPLNLFISLFIPSVLIFNIVISSRFLATIPIVLSNLSSNVPSFSPNTLNWLLKSSINAPTSVTVNAVFDLFVSFFIASNLTQGKIPVKHNLSVRDGRHIFSSSPAARGAEKISDGFVEPSLKKIANSASFLFSGRAYGGIDQSISKPAIPGPRQQQLEELLAKKNNPFHASLGKIISDPASKIRRAIAHSNFNAKGNSGLMNNPPTNAAIVSNFAKSPINLAKNSLRLLVQKISPIKISIAARGLIVKPILSSSPAAAKSRTSGLKKWFNTNKDIFISASVMLGVSGFILGLIELFQVGRFMLEFGIYKGFQCNPPEIARRVVLFLAGSFIINFTILKSIREYYF